MPSKKKGKKRGGGEVIVASMRDSLVLTSASESFFVTFINSENFVVMFN